MTFGPEWNTGETEIRSIMIELTMTEAATIVRKAVDDADIVDGRIPGTTWNTMKGDIQAKAIQGVIAMVRAMQELGYRIIPMNNPIQTPEK